jgi:hypothetical protein
MCFYWSEGRRKEDSIHHMSVMMVIVHKSIGFHYAGALSYYFPHSVISEQSAGLVFFE